MNAQRRPRRLLTGCSGLVFAVCLALVLGGALLVRGYTQVEARFDYAHYAPTPAPVAVPGDVIAVAAGGRHTLALGADGMVWAWGNNTYGQLANETGRYCGMDIIKSMSCSRRPLRVPGLPAIRAIAAGESHSIALDADGRVWAWGWNAYGQLGDGLPSAGAHAVPAPVPALAGIVAIAASGDRTLALGADGTVWQWGADSFGGRSCGSQANAPARTCDPAPVRVPELAGATAIALGGDHGLALRADGTVWAWGSNEVGQLGDGTTTDRRAPVRVGALTGITAIAAGAAHSVAVGPGGAVWGWGANVNGQLGTGSRDTCRSYACSLTPLALPANTDTLSVVASGNRTLFLQRDGGVMLLGEIAVISPSDATVAACKLTPPTHVIYRCLARPTPIAQLGGATAVAIAGADGQVFALVRDPTGRGTVWSWGYNYDGQLGRD